MNESEIQAVEHFVSFETYSRFLKSGHTVKITTKIGAIEASVEITPMLNLRNDND